MELAEIQIELLKEEIKKLHRKLEIDANDQKTKQSLAEIRSILQAPEVATPPENNQVEIGKEFTVHLDYGDGDTDTLTSILVKKKLVANPNLTSTESLVGRAILGRSIGESFSYKLDNITVNGRILDARIPSMERARTIVKAK